jgi:DNA-binding NtrC family response regulator
MPEEDWVQAALPGDSPGIIGVREEVATLLRRLRERQAGSRPPTILLQGETGTGKGYLAKAIHRASPRAAGPFKEVNCAAIAETLMESGLFGVERGAFTDARESKPGLFQAAHRGTLFLDEIGELPHAVQAKLLTALESGVVRRVGSTREEAVDLWIIAASNRDLAAAVRGGRFREDLYYRLAVVPLFLPPLRERGDDIFLLADRFLAELSASQNVPPKTLGAEARAVLRAHVWPDNVRGLRNALERAVLFSSRREREISARELRGALKKLGGAVPLRADAPGGHIRVHPAPTEAPASLRDAVRVIEKERMDEALRAAGGNKTQAAKLLGMKRTTFVTKLRLLERQGSAPPTPRRGGRDAAWVEITKPAGAQRQLFEESEDVYGRLFPEPVRAPWSEFRGYIDATQAKLRSGAVDFRDQYFVAVVGQRVRGMAFLTSYPRDRLCFVSYFGVLPTATLGGSALAGRGLQDEVFGETVGEVEAYLFEVEKIAPRQLDMPDPRIRNRIQAQRVFQELGARKIRWLLYDQPDLDWTADRSDDPAASSRHGEGRETSIHLMVVRTDWSSPGYLTRADVRRYLDFVYNRFYYDGFKTGDPGADRRAGAYLAGLFESAMASLPESAQEVFLDEVALARRKPVVLLAELGGLEPTLLALLAERLEALGILVVSEARDARRRRIGVPLFGLDPTLGRIDVVIGVRSAATGRAAEPFPFVERLRGRRVIYLVERRLAESGPAVESDKPGPFGTGMVFFFERGQFHWTIEQVVYEVLKTDRQTGAGQDQ